MKKKLLIIPSLALLLVGCGTCKVTYTTYGGTPIEETQIKKGELIDAPYSAKKGYSLVGWYFDEYFNDLVSFPLEVKEDTNLYAKWIVSNSDDDFVYNLKDNGEYEVVDYKGVANTITIPSEYKGTKVTSIANYGFFRLSNKVENLIIPEGIISIGDWAFTDADGLRNITLPTSLQNIGNYGFYDCDMLNTINLNEYVVLGENALSGRNFPGCHCNR